MRVRYKNLFAFTGDAALPLMESFVVEDGRIVPDDAPADRDVDLAGGFVTPLFSDQHTHPSYVAQTLSALAALPPDVLSIEDLVEGLVRKKDELPEDAWIEGWGYDESLLKENRSPTRHDLDRVATDRPVFVRRSDCHSAVVNTYLLKAAGIDRTTPDPEGGRFGRDASGEPDGRLIETAAVRRVERLRKKEDFEGNVRRMCALGEHYLSRGIGFVTEMMCERGEKDLLPVYRAAREAGLPLTVGMYLIWQSSSEKTAKRFEKIDPYLVSVPQGEKISGKMVWDYEVKTLPKVELVLKNTPESEPPRQNQPLKKVKTGDETKIAAYLLLAGASAMILLKAIWKKERADLL